MNSLTACGKSRSWRTTALQKHIIFPAEFCMETLEETRPVGYLIRDNFIKVVFKSYPSGGYEGEIVTLVDESDSGHGMTSR
jgi:hypothetical protein